MTIRNRGQGGTLEGKDSEKNGHVSSVIYYANIFALAFTCGTIQAYFTKDPIDLLN